MVKKGAMPATADRDDVRQKPKKTKGGDNFSAHLTAAMPAAIGSGTAQKPKKGKMADNFSAHLMGALGGGKGVAGCGPGMKGY